ncbi:MAG: mitochondrial fission ELM1 family protein, partial [Candidatus Pacebacteria bacterium]|nr:mitochondrial fission ELM1 family protein [Candidatus Paceibacterota bacterium]
AIGYEPAAIIAKTVNARFPWRFLPPRWWFKPLLAIKDKRLQPPWPELLIACGRSAVAPAAELKRRAGKQMILVAVQEPKLPPKQFDLIITAFHDGLKGANILQTMGAMNRISPATLAVGRAEFKNQFKALPRPLIGLCLGGSNRRMKVDAAAVERLVEQLRDLVLPSQGGAFGLVVTASRRTPPMVLAAFDALLAEAGGDRMIFWRGEGSNPYFGILALADYLIVTADSVSMMSEAATTGTPVMVAELASGVGKFNDFYREMESRGLVKRFTGVIDRPWKYQPLNDTARAAERVKLLQGRQQ